MSSLLPVGQRVVVVGGKHFGRAGAVAGLPSGYPQWYVLRLDGGDVVSAAPNDVAAVR